VALLNLADSLNESGQATHATGVLGHAVKTTPSDALLWYQLGIVDSNAGRDAHAIAAFEKSVSLDPDLAEAHNLLGAALATGGDLERGERELRNAAQINPDLPEALGNLAPGRARRTGRGCLFLREIRSTQVG
jgi:Flp pilus assembly protein TadD